MLVKGLNAGYSNPNKNSQSFGAAEIIVRGDDVKILITKSLKKAGMFSKEMIDSGDSDKFLMRPWGDPSGDDVNLNDGIVKGWTETLRNLGKDIEVPEKLKPFMIKIAEGLESLKSAVKAKDSKGNCDEGYEKAISLLKEGSLKGSYNDKGILILG